MKEENVETPLWVDAVFYGLFMLFPAGVILEIVGLITANQAGWLVVASLGLPLLWLFIAVLIWGKTNGDD